jgi:hypothetical protein
VVAVTEERSALAEDPGVVFSVKELIGRLDGKLDMIMQALANKADRSDVNALGERVGKLEGKVDGMHEREVQREAAQEAENKAEQSHREDHRYRIGAWTAAGLLLAAVATIVVMILNHKGG